MSASLAEEGADTDKLMARMDDLQTRIDAANGWGDRANAAAGDGRTQMPARCVTVLNMQGRHDVISAAAFSGSAPLSCSVYEQFVGARPASAL